MKILMSLLFFFVMLTANDTGTAVSKKIDINNEELRLMLNSFLYNGDVEHAYKVAKIAYKKYPASRWWLDKLIETALWSNHPRAALQYKKILYQKTKDETLRDDIIKASLKLYQYESIEDLVIGKFKEKPSEENAQFLLFIEYKIGNPQKAAVIFEEQYKKEPQSNYLLSNLLKIYIDTGDMNKAKRIVSLMENKKLFDKTNVFLMTNYYYSRYNIEKAYTTLLHLQKADIKEPLYYKAVSDFGWYLNDLKNAAEASDYLVRTKQARVVDYDRVIEFYKKSKPLYSAEVAKEGYLYVRKPYFFFYYAEVMLHYAKYDALRDTMNALQKSKDKLVSSSANYWLIEAQVAKHYNERDRSVDAVLHALALAPKNINIFQNAVTTLIEIGAYKKAEMVLAANEERYALETESKFLYASLYFQLNDIDRANAYLQEVLQTESEIKESLEFAYLQASIHEAQGRRSLALQEYREILDKLENDFVKNPLLRQKDDILVIYFAAALNVYDTEKFTQELESNKQYLTPQEYANISYSLATKESAFAKSHEIYAKTKERALWMQLSDALLFTNYTRLENLLHYNLEALPKLDATAAAQKDKQIALAQSLGFKAMQTNFYNNDAYLTYLDMAKKRDSIFSSTLSMYERDPLSQKILRLSNRNYLAHDFYLYEKVDIYKNSSQDTTELFNLNDQTTRIDFGVKKEWQRAELLMHYGYKKALANYVQYGLLADYTLTQNLHIHADYEQGMDVEDSTYLYVGAKKEMIALSADYAILDSLVWDVLYQRNYFSSQDDKELGDENYFRTALNKQLRVGYPDIGVGIFFDRGIYKQTAYDYGVLETITNERTILPQSFYNIGTEFRYGMQNADIYTRVWRPYFSISPYYNSYANNFDIGINAGYGGKVYKNDHLIFGFDYSQPTNGVNDKIYKLFVNYKILY